MQVGAGLDTGPVLLQRELALSASDTAESVHEELAALGAEALLEAVEKQLAKWLELVNNGNLPFAESKQLIICIGRLSNILKQEQATARILTQGETKGVIP